MSRHKRQLVATAISVCAACALLATPAFADDGKGGGGRSGGGGGGDNHGHVTTTTITTTAPLVLRDDRGRGDDHPRPALNPIPQLVHLELEAGRVPAAAVVNFLANEHDNRGPGNAFDREDNRGPGNARDRDDEAVPATVNDLVVAINNEVAALTNANVVLEVQREFERNEAEIEVEHLHVISLSALTAGLSADDAAAITNAVNANKDALQAFLGSGGANSNAIDAALNAINVPPSSVLAILTDGEHVLAVTA
jgi:hypothetical protein